MYHYFLNNSKLTRSLIQVAALAPLALLLVLEARCAHFVIAHFKYFVLWSSDSTHDIIHDDKIVSEHYPDCNGNSSAHVYGGPLGTFPLLPGYWILRRGSRILEPGAWPQSAINIIQ